MGLNIVAYPKPTGVVEMNIETDYNDESTYFGADEKLLTLIEEVGKKQDGVFVIFNEDKLRKLIDISEMIDGGTFQEEKEYKYRYKNETMLDFYKRWDFNIKKLKNLLFQTRWDEEHVVIYISC